MFTNWAGDEYLILICIKMLKKYLYLCTDTVFKGKVPSSISIKDSRPGISSINVFHQLPQNAKSSQARKQRTHELNTKY